MHYVAMVATSFASAGGIVIAQGPVLTQHNLAFIVAITTFLICGMFLVIVLPDQKRGEERSREAPMAVAPALGEPERPAPAAPPRQPARIPVRRNQSVFFAEPG